MGNPNQFKEKYGPYALVTGASSGLGKEFAIQLASKGMNLVLLARRKELLIDLKEDLEKTYSIHAIVCPIDLSEENFLDKLKPIIHNIEIGLLINNAGFGNLGEFLENDEKKEAESVKVNILAPLFLSNFIGKQMRDRKKGGIIFLSSISGYVPTPLLSTYSATKAFDLHLGCALNKEFSKYNIDVLVSSPGLTITEFFDKENIDLRKTAISPLLLKPDKVVRDSLNSLGKKEHKVIGIWNQLLIFFTTKIFSKKMGIRIAGFFTYLIRK